MARGFTGFNLWGASLTSSNHFESRIEQKCHEYLYLHHFISSNEQTCIYVLFLCFMCIFICIIQLFCEQRSTKMSISCGILSFLHLTCGQRKHSKLFQHQNYLLGPFNLSKLWANTKFLITHKQRQQIFLTKMLTFDNALIKHAKDKCLYNKDLVQKEFSLEIVNVSKCAIDLANFQF